MRNKVSLFCLLALLFPLFGFAQITENLESPHCEVYQTFDMAYVDGIHYQLNSPYLAVFTMDKCQRLLYFDIPVTDTNESGPRLSFSLKVLHESSVTTKIDGVTTLMTTTIFTDRSTILSIQQLFKGDVAYIVAMSETTLVFEESEFFHQIHWELKNCVPQSLGR
jgi:hypothetical protein